MEKKYHIITYGCQMNVHESEKLAGILREHSFVETKEREQADLIVLNTCCIRETAETHILGNLGIIKKLKEKKPSLIVAVCGCMTQQQSMAEKLKKRCPFINIIFGTHNLHLFGEYLEELGKKKYVVDVWNNEQDIIENVPIYRTSGLNAWVNIMYGCNNFCSYCIVPYVRGRERSRNADLIVNDVKDLVEKGYKEVTLLGQNVNSYGQDSADKKHLDFNGLLQRIDSEVCGKYRLKFMTSHPKDLSEDVIKTIAQSNKIANFIHLPVQAGNDRVLKLMNRKYTSMEYLQKIDLIKKYIPSVGLSTDIMVGFPTETEAEFLDTLSLIERVGFNNIYSFIYSRRSGTVADKMDGQIETAVKKDRIKRLIQAQSIIEKNLSSKMIGKTVEALVCSFDENKQLGRTDCNKIVSFKNEENLVGNFVNLKIIGNKNSNLFAEITNE